MTPHRVASIASTSLRSPRTSGLTLDYGPAFSLRLMMGLEAMWT